jgi:hypothetical protein
MATPTFLPATTNSSRTGVAAGAGSGLKVGGLPNVRASMPPQQQQPAPQPTPSTPYPSTPGSFASNPGGQDPTGKKYDVDPAGRMTPWTPYSSGPGQTSWRPGETEDLFDLNAERMMRIMRSIGGPGGEGASAPREGYTPVERETPTTMADRTAAESAAFGRGKDRVSKIGGSAMDALKDMMSVGGHSGSGLEAAMMRDLAASTAGQLGEVTRDQTLDRMARTDQVDDRNMAHGLTQRGQDIGQATTNYQGGIQQRGQDLAAAQAERQAVLSWLPQMLQAFQFRV